MPLATFSGVAATDEVIPSERISDYLAGFEYGNNLAAALAWMEPGQGVVPVTFPRWNQVSAAPTTPAETVAFADRNIDMDDSDITPGFKGYRFPVSDEVEITTGAGISASRLDQAMQGLLDFIERDLLSVSTSATVTSGSVTRNYNLDEFRDDMAAYDALEVPDETGSGIVAVIHSTAAHQLKGSWSTTAATHAGDDGDFLRMGIGNGFVGNLYGVAVYKSRKVPNESTGASGMMTRPGPQASAYGLVMPELPRIERSRGDDAVARAVTYYVLRSMYGVGLTNPRRGLELLTQR